MLEISLTPGLVVCSKAGRDSGRYFIVLEIVSPEYVLIADGQKHRLAHPKKKKVKHLKLTEDVLESIGRKLTEKRQVFDNEVRSALRTYNES